MPVDKEEKPRASVSIEALRAELEKLPARADVVEALRAELEKVAAKKDVEGLRAEIQRLRAEVASLKKATLPPGGAAAGPPPSGPPPPQLVTLDQIGAMVHRSKRSMERYRDRMPPPRVRGRRGQPHLWAWHEVRPWLEETFGVTLPEAFPGTTH